MTRAPVLAMLNRQHRGVAMISRKTMAAVLWTLTACGSAWAENAARQPAPPPIATAPPEMAAVLDGRYGTDCAALDLNTWRHPVRTVLENRPEVHLQWGLLCQRRTYPVFGVDFDLDPQGETDRFFHPLFHDLLQANGWWTYTLVAARDGLTITVSGSRKGDMAIHYGEITEAP